MDVLVSEWMGYALLFESMLDTVLYARDRYRCPLTTYRHALHPSDLHKDASRAFHACDAGLSRSDRPVLSSCFVRGSCISPTLQS